MYTILFLHLAPGLRVASGHCAPVRLLRLR